VHLYSTWKKIFVLNKRGQRLVGLLRLSNTKAGIASNINLGESKFEKTAVKEYSSAAENNPVIIVCHGFTGSKEGNGEALKMADELGRLGYNTLLFDFAGCGESEGMWEDITLSSHMEDLGSIVDWCEKQGFSKFILTGRSFGGTTVLCYTARDPRISGACTWAAVARTTELFSQFTDDPLDGPGDDRVAIAGEEGIIYLKREFFQDLKRHDIVKCTAAIAPRNLLVIHGTRDELVPPEDAELIYNAAKEPKDLIFIEGADHQFSNHTRKVWDVFFNWLQKNFPPHV